MFDGKDLTRMNDDPLTLLRRHQIGFIFQSFNLLPMFTAEQNILMPLTLAGAKPDRLSPFANKIFYRLVKLFPNFIS